MNPRVVTPATQVIELDRARLQCKLAGNDRDDELADAIETARAWMQEQLQQTIGPQRLEFTYPTWCGSVVLPYDITALQALTANGVDVKALAVVSGRTVTVAGTAPVVITIDTGYTAANVPGPIRSAMLLVIADLIRNQQSQVEVELFQNRALEALMWPWRERLPL